MGIMAVQGIFKGVYWVHVHHMARKTIPVIYNPVCKEVLVGSGVSVFFNNFKTIISSGTNCKIK